MLKHRLNGYFEKLDSWDSLRTDAPRTWPWPTRHGEDFRQFGHAWNLTGAEIREFIVAVRRINRARHRAVRRVASRSLIRCVGASWRRVTNDTRLLLPVYAMLSVWCYAMGQGRERVKGALWRTIGEKERVTVRVYDARKEIEGRYHRSWVSLEFLVLSSFICIDNTIDNTIWDLGNG